MLSIVDSHLSDVFEGSKINCSLCDMMLTTVLLTPTNPQVLNLESASLKCQQ